MSFLHCLARTELAEREEGRLCIVVRYNTSSARRRTEVQYENSCDHMEWYSYNKDKTLFPN
jgi:hypothetical protein